jgi:hypothetical protein
MVLIAETAPVCTMPLADSTSWGSVNYSSPTPFHYKISFVFDGKFPRTGQDVGEDSPKGKRRNWN